ncbi:MAG: hypothetical protein GF317_04395 [Candidatus Lokiarchaeota archaeon]|nr:hypothetical protein [Candidatus Lokiarchaeota archaeon]MBD3199129.1 hypothetical protein [Candidatus Lokiarchaeota archaeon]
MDNKEVLRIVSLFFSEYRQEIFDFYDNFFNYLKDLLSYKKLHLDDLIDINSEKSSIENLYLMKKVIKIGLNTIGIDTNELIDGFMNHGNRELQFDSDKESIKNILEKYFDNFIKKLLLNILFEYICNQNNSKINNLNQFDLLPRNFIEKMDNFKAKFQIDNERTFFEIKSIIDKFVNSSSLEIKQKSENFIHDPLVESNQSIISELRDAIEQNLSALKSDITSTRNSISKLRTDKTEKKQNAIFSYKTNSYLDYFINTSSLSPRAANIINLNKQNLISYFSSNHYNLDLESIFYSITIIKMLDLQKVLNLAEIDSLLLNFQENGSFHSSHSICPDPINNYYGLYTLLYLKLNGYDTRFNMDKQKEYLISELQTSTAENYILNCYLIYALTAFNDLDKLNRINYYNLLNKLKKEINERILDNVSQSKEFESLYGMICLMKLLESNLVDVNYPPMDINQLFIKITEENFEEVSISSLVKLLLIPKLSIKYNLDEILVKKSIEYIKYTKFFQDSNGTSSFHWKDNKLALKMELRMLYWVLLAFSQYYSYI